MSTDSKVLAHISGADQRPNLQDDVGAHNGDDRPKHQAGVDNSHLNTDAKDEKSIANKLDQASKQDKAEKQAENQPKPPPTQAAINHGNEPSKGAKIDEALQAEDEAILRKKGIK